VPISFLRLPLRRRLLLCWGTKVLSFLFFLHLPAPLSSSVHFISSFLRNLKWKITMSYVCVYIYCGSQHPHGRSPPPPPPRDVTYSHTQTHARAPTTGGRRTCSCLLLLIFFLFLNY
jgi:hypothetical protein